MFSAPAEHNYAATSKWIVLIDGASPLTSSPLCLSFTHHSFFSYFHNSTFHSPSIEVLLLLCLCSVERSRCDCVVYCKFRDYSPSVLHTTLFPFFQLNICGFYCPLFPSFLVHLCNSAEMLPSLSFHIASFMQFAIAISFFPSRTSFSMSWMELLFFRFVVFITVICSTLLIVYYALTFFLSIRTPYKIMLIIIIIIFIIIVFFFYCASLLLLLKSQNRQRQRRAASSCWHCCHISSSDKLLIPPSTNQKKKNKNSTHPHH